MINEGIIFETGKDVGIDISGTFLTKKYDAVCLTCGAREARDLPVPGRNLKGIHFAMDFLSQQNKRNNNEEVTDLDILAKNKHVVVIGGGDTGSDCVGTSIRQNAASVTQIEIMPKPPEDRTDSTPWPLWPYQLRTSSSHKEGCKRSWNVMTKNFEEENGKIKKINAVKVEWEMSDEGMPVKFKEVPGSEFSLDADLVFLSMGFTGPEKSPILSQFD